jgi:hypothetical protein
MIETIYIEKLLLELFNILNENLSDNFKNQLLHIIKRNEESLTDNYLLKINNKSNICNHIRTRKRGFCKRKCINNNYCIYHAKNNPETKINTGITHIPDNLILLPNKVTKVTLPYKNQVKPYIPDNINTVLIPKIIEYNFSENLNKYDKLILDKNIKIKKNKCVYLEDNQDFKKSFRNKTLPCEFHVKPNDKPDNILKLKIHEVIDNTPIYSKLELIEETRNKKKLKCYFMDESFLKINEKNNENIDIINKTKKKMKKRKSKNNKKYIHEYKLICNYYTTNIHKNITSNPFLNLITKIKIKNIFNYDKYKNYSREGLIDIFENTLKLIFREEGERVKETPLSCIVTYMIILNKAFENNNYNIEELIEFKKSNKNDITLDF